MPFSPGNAILGHADGIALQHQQGFKRFADGRLVIDDEDASGLDIAGRGVRGQHRSAFRHALLS
jgi:imidazoleglycerol phosphate dehydratase HisB